VGAFEPHGTIEVPEPACISHSGRGEVSEGLEALSTAGLETGATILDRRYNFRKSARNAS